MKQGRDLIRTSIGTAAALGLISCRLTTKPTTAYLMTHSKERCRANCAFCSQAKRSVSKPNRLSRVVWPTFDLNRVLESLTRSNCFQRVCVQALNYPGLLDDLLHIFTQLREETHLPTSLSCQPLEEDQMRELRNLGLDTIAIPLDAATPRLFDEVKGSAVEGPYSWKRHMKTLKEAVEVFGPGRVYTHLIVGLGETEQESLKAVQKLVDVGVIPALFAFTPLLGTKLEDRPPPPLDSYRRVQLGRFFLSGGHTRFEKMAFNRDGRVTDFGVRQKFFREVLLSGEPFFTSGCPGCNRPYYNESPKGPIYNYPCLPKEEELAEIERKLF